MSRISLTLDVERICRFLIWCSLSVLALGFFREMYVLLVGTGTVVEDLRHIALDTEHCLGSFYSSVLIGLAALIMAALGQQEKDPSRRQRWFVLACVFVILSVDESVSFHEVLIDPLRPLFAFSSFLYFAWIVPGAAFVIVFGLAYLPFVLSFPPKARNRIILSGALFVTGALGLEAVGGHYNSLGGFDHPLYIMAFLAEESLEILGMTLFVDTLLRLVSDGSPEAARSGTLARAPAE